jgi:hypothetical protein
MCIGPEVGIAEIPSACATSWGVRPSTTQTLLVTTGGGGSPGRGQPSERALATRELKSYLQAVWQRYRKPIWLTEYALTDFGTSPARYPTWSQQAAFVTASAAMLERLPHLRRYAWFALPSTSTDGTVGLYRSGARPPRRQAYRLARGRVALPPSSRAALLRRAAVAAGPEAAPRDRPALEATRRPAAEREAQRA